MPVEAGKLSHWVARAWTGNRNAATERDIVLLCVRDDPATPTLTQTTHMIVHT